MLPVMFARVGCKHYERKPIYLVLWLKYKYCEQVLIWPPITPSLDKNVFRLGHVVSLSAGIVDLYRDVLIDGSTSNINARCKKKKEKKKYPIMKRK